MLQGQMWAQKKRRQSPGPNVEPGGAECVAAEPASLVLSRYPCCSSHLPPALPIPLLQVHISYLPENILTCPVREILPICEHEDEELVCSKGGRKRQWHKKICGLMLIISSPGFGGSAKVRHFFPGFSRAWKTV